MTAHYEFLSVATEGGVATVTLSSPPVNALTRALMQELHDAATAFSRDPSLRVVVMQSADEKFFMPGSDLNMMNGTWDGTMLETIRAYHAVTSAWEKIPVPTIAVIDGYALGAGCELPRTFDFRLMGDRARIGCPEVKIGLIASGGGTQRLPRLVGVPAALDLLLRGRPVSAQEAWRIGLATEHVASEHLEARAQELARELAALPTLAVQQTKRCVRNGMDASLGLGLVFEEQANTFLAGTADAQEGVGAFLDKRTPVFTGH